MTSLNRRYLIIWVVLIGFLGLLFANSTALATQPAQSFEGETNTPTSSAAYSITATVTPSAEIVAANDFFFFFLPFINQPVDTPTPTTTPSPTPSATPSPPPPPETMLYCDNLSAPLFIPDNNPTGISNQFSIADPRRVVHLSVYVDISHTWVSDLTVTLSNLSTGETQTIIDRPGYPQTTYGCGNNNIITILDDQAEQPVESQCYTYPAAISGAYQPNESLQNFTGSAIAGPWR